MKNSLKVLVSDLWQHRWKGWLLRCEWIISLQCFVSGYQKCSLNWFKWCPSRGCHIVHLECLWCNFFSSDGKVFETKCGNYAQYYQWVQLRHGTRYLNFQYSLCPITRNLKVSQSESHSLLFRITHQCWQPVQWFNSGSYYMVGSHWEIR